MKESLHRIIPFLLYGVSFLLLVYFLWWHGVFAVYRYFDVDEFAHLHWISHMIMGKWPYRDFLTFFPPGFLWFLAPSFAIGWGTVTPILTARLMMFAVFVGIVASAGLLFWEMRRSWVAVIVPLLLAFLPLPFDKFVEIRPDNPAALFLLVGMYFQVRWMREGRRLSAFAAGFCYSTSVLVLTKMVPAVMPGIGLALWELSRGNRTATRFFFGFGFPLGIVGLWLLTLGDVGTVLYSLVQLPIEANKISTIFFMAPDLFFYPNGIFYGTNGWSRELLSNHLLWIVGLTIGIYRLVTAFGKSELLVAGTFILQVVMYIQFVPLKHAQYLVPIAPFVAWYVADGVGMIWKKVGGIAFAAAFLVAAFYLFDTSESVNRPKLGWTNNEAIAFLKNLYTTIPKTEYILDLDGRTLYYPDPYYACCIPFGQFAPFLSRQLPSLAAVLEKTQTRYIYQGQLERVKTLLPEDQEYILSRYKQLVNGDPQLLIRTN